jgi:hypothetical protein
MMKAYGAKRRIRGRPNNNPAEEEGKSGGDHNAYHAEPEHESDTDDDELSKSWKSSGGGALVVDTTPEKKALNRVEYTPMGAEKEVFKYYCPLCMFYYEEVQQSGCCKNYICYQCAVQYVAGKGAVGTNIKSLPKSLKSISCPHCATDDLELTTVCKSAAVRLYHDTPTGQGEEDDTFDNNPANENVPSFRRGCSSPVKIGDSFDDLKRKMLSFDDAASKNDNNDSDAANDLKGQDVEARSQDDKGPTSRSGTPPGPSEQSVLTEMPDVMNPANDDDDDIDENSRRGFGGLEESVPEFYETAVEGASGLGAFAGLEGGFSTPRIDAGPSHDMMRTPGEFGSDSDGGDGSGSNAFPQPQQPMLVV